MFTRNYYNALTALLGKEFNTDVPCVTVSNTKGVFYPDTKLSKLFFPSVTMGDSYDHTKLKTTVSMTATTDEANGIFIGTGTTAPTIDDYTFAGTQITAFSVLKTSVTSNIADNVVTLKHQYVIQNTGASEFTIGEIGYFGWANMNSSSQKVKFLFERTVLDNPLTVPAGGTATIDYNWVITTPTV